MVIKKLITKISSLVLRTAILAQFHILCIIIYICNVLVYKLLCLKNELNIYFVKGSIKRHTCLVLFTS